MAGESSVVCVKTDSASKEEETKTDEPKPDRRYLQLVLSAVRDLKEYKKGSSRAKIRAYICTQYRVELQGSRFSAALKQGVEQGLLSQQGVSYKLVERPSVSPASPVSRMSCISNHSVVGHKDALAM